MNKRDKLALIELTDDECSGRYIRTKNGKNYNSLCPSIIDKIISIDEIEELKNCFRKVDKFLEDLSFCRTFKIDLLTPLVKNTTPPETFAEVHYALCRFEDKINKIIDRLNIDK